MSPLLVRGMTMWGACVPRPGGKLHDGLKVVVQRVPLGEGSMDEEEFIQPHAKVVLSAEAEPLKRGDVSRTHRHDDRTPSPLCSVHRMSCAAAQPAAGVARVEVAWRGGYLGHVHELIRPSPPPSRCL